jgi:hypothetical protein
MQRFATTLHHNTTPYRNKLRLYGEWNTETREFSMMWILTTVAVGDVGLAWGRYLMASTFSTIGTMQHSEDPACVLPKQARHNL